MSHSKKMKLASRGKRLGAYCIDKAIPFIAGIVFFTIGSIRMVSGPVNYGFGYGYGYGYGYNRGMSGAMSAALFIMILLLIGYIVAELIFFSKSKTIGKAALGMQVVSSVNGEPIGFWSMLFREWFVKKASSSVFFLGYIWVCIDDRNRGWHDKILDTYVVDLKESEALNRPKEKASPEDHADTKPADAKAEISGDTVQEISLPAETADPVDTDAVSAEPDTADEIEIHAEITETVPQIEAVSDEAAENAAVELSKAADACTE